MIKKYFLPAAYMFSMSLIGLDFYFAFIPLIILFFVVASQSKEDLIISVFILTFNFGLVSQQKIFLGLKSFDVLIPIILITYLFKNKFIIENEQAKIIKPYLIFLAINFLIQIISPDNLISKIAGFRYFLGFLFFLVPFLVYKKKEFNFNNLIVRFTEYWVIFGIFIVLQAIIIKQPFLITYMNKDLISPVKADFILRVYPVPFAFIIFYLYTLHYNKIKPLFLIITLLALLGSLNRSLWFAVLFFTLIRSGLKLKVRLLTLLISFFLLLIYIEAFYNYNFRIFDLYYQFSDFYNLKSTSTLNNLGTGRLLQAINPINIFLQRGNIFFGTGFLSAEKSTVDWYFSNLFIGYNRFITEIEISQVSYFISGGIIGFANLFWLFIKIWRIIKSYLKSDLFLKSLVFIFIIQFGGFYSFQSSETWGLLGLILGIIVKEGKDKS
jgi:hypothetical protein